MLNKKITSFDRLTLRLIAMRYACEYEIVCRGDGSVVTRYMMRCVPDGTEMVPEGSVDVPTDEVLRVLNDCGVSGWDGFHGQHPRGVRDGTMFRFTATVNGGEEIDADGSENFPRHFRELRDYVETKLRGE